MFSYRTILKQALNLSWKNKFLWFFGLFASLTIAGGSMEYQFITQNFGQGITSGSSQGLDNLLKLINVFKLFYLGFVDLFSQNILIILNSLSIILLVLTFLAVFVWLAISSQAALVDTVKKILIPKRKPYDPNLREALSIGNKYFWPLLGLNVLIGLLVSGVLFISSLPLLLMMLSNSYAFVIAYSIIFVISVITAVSLSLIVKYAISFKVLENESFIKSLEKGYYLFKKNWLISLEVAIILFLINVLASFVLLLGITIFILPLFLNSLLLGSSWLTLLFIFLILVIVIIYGSFLTTFQISSWTNLYLQLKSGQGQSKLERIFHKK